MPGGSFGSSLAGADVNGDGFGDIVVGDPKVDGETGRDYVYLGSASGLSLLSSVVHQGARADRVVSRGIDPERVRAHLEEIRGVSAVHDLHIWPLSTADTALTCHLVMKEGSPGDTFLVEIAHQLKERFGIAHATIQVETGEAACVLEPDHIV